MTLDPCPTGCGQQANLAVYVMCSACWRRVPKPFRDAVTVAWKKRRSAFGQGREAYAAAAAEHEAAKDAAIKAAT